MYAKCMGFKISQVPSRCNSLVSLWREHRPSLDYDRKRLRPSGDLAISWVFTQGLRCTLWAHFMVKKQVDRQWVLVHVLARLWMFLSDKLREASAWSPESQPAANTELGALGTARKRDGNCLPHSTCNTTETSISINRCILFIDTIWDVAK